MLFQLKTTLNINDAVMKQLKQEALRQGKIMSGLVETAIRRLFKQRRRTSNLPPLASFESGGTFVDLSNQ